MTDAFVLTNARVIAPDRVFGGWVAIKGGLIVELGEGQAPEGGIDCDGDYVLPGLIELHTDHLEAHFTPRPQVRWNAVSAVIAYDAQMAAAGITTVFDSLRLGGETKDDLAATETDLLADALDTAREHDLLRAEHLTHLRCEIATLDGPASALAFVARRKAHLLSLMDHTPGQRQFRDLDKMRIYYARHGLVTQEEFDAFCRERLKKHAALAVENRRTLVELAHREGIVLASHDDATLDEVAEATRDRVSIAEFPTTLEAAQASHEKGIQILMGAPNVVRGGSHSGNVAAAELAAAGLLDILSSDYVPASLLLAAFELPERVPAYDLAHAIRLVTCNPAAATKLHDRGSLAPGQRADVIRVRARGHVPVVRTVWRAGTRVA